MDEVERVFRHLIEVLADEHPERLHRPLQASEIYQTVIPYRRFRSALRFDTNQDYEMALLRLLAGEREYVSIEPPQAQEDLLSEAESINPNPSRIRDYAGVKVFLNANIVRELLNEREAFAPPSRDPEPEPPSVDVDVPIESFPVSAFELEEPGAAATAENVAGDDLQPAPDIVDFGLDKAVNDARASRLEEVVPDQQMHPDSAEEPAHKTGDEMDAIAPDSGNGTADSTCRYCAADLPRGRTVIFCPFCGKNQSIRCCAICGTELDHDWAFCVICGAAADGGR